VGNRILLLTFKIAAVVKEQEGVRQQVAVFSVAVIPGIAMGQQRNAGT
jgi:hypothetical protein